MEMLGRWITKSEAMREMSISLSTLDRMIRRGEVEAAKQERSVYVLAHGLEPSSENDLLETTRKEIAESERAASGLRGTVSALRQTVLRLEWELDTARYKASALEIECGALRTACREESVARRHMKRSVIALSLIACSLLVLLIL